MQMLISKIERKADLLKLNRLTNYLLCFTVMAFQFHVRNYRTKICVINKNVASNRFSKTSYP